MQQTHADKGIQKDAKINNQMLLKKRLFTPKEAAEYLARPVSAIRTLIQTGKIPVIKESRRLYLDVIDINDYIRKAKETIQ